MDCMIVLPVLVPPMCRKAYGLHWYGAGAHRPEAATQQQWSVTEMANGIVLIQGRQEGRSGQVVDRQQPLTLDPCLATWPYT